MEVDNQRAATTASANTARPALNQHPSGCGARNRNRAKLSMMALCLSCASASYGQQSGASKASFSIAEPADGSVAPHLINFSGTIDPQITQIRQNEPQTRGSSPAINISFPLYELQEGGPALWSESRKVQLDKQGRYTVLLGCTQLRDLLLELFTSGKARWLGAQLVADGDPAAEEKPRIPLVGIPYTLKAAPADTLGRLSASAFLQVTGTRSAPKVTNGILSTSGLELGPRIYNMKDMLLSWAILVVSTGLFFFYSVEILHRV